MAATLGESPFVALGVVVAGGHIDDAADRLVDHCHNCACTELAVVGVAAAEDGGLDVAWQVRQHVAWHAVGTWEIGG